MYHDRIPAPQAPAMVQQIYSMPPQAVGHYAYDPAPSPMPAYHAPYTEQQPIMAKVEEPPMVMAYAAPVDVAPRTAQVLIRIYRVLLNL
jgi:hypothetical protein